MKRKLFFLLTILAFNLNLVHSQSTIDENSVIKDENGKTITYSQFMDYMRLGDYVVMLKEDKNSTYFQLQKATKKQKEQMLKMMMGQDDDDKTGQETPNFEFTDMNGKKLTKQNTEGKVVVFNFWFTTCKPCINEIPELNKIYEKYNKNKDIVFASITYEGEKQVRKFLNRKKIEIKYPIITDSRLEIKKFGFNGYPTNVVIGKDGKYSFFMTGGFPGIGEVIDKSIANALK